MANSPFELIGSREVYRNPWISVQEDQVVRPDGTRGIFGLITMKAGSTVLAVTPELDTFLTREYKYGLRSESLELVSGALEEGESPMAAAARELEEELGYRANRWIDAGTLHPFTTVVDSPNYMFIALELEKTSQRLDDGEVLTMERVPLIDAIDMVMKSQITHGASCVLLLKAQAILRSEGLLP